MKYLQKSTLATKYNIIIFDSVHDDMDKIYNFCSNISIKYASNIRNKITDSIHSLRYLPFATPIYCTFGSYVTRKKIVENRYLIVFTVIQNFVFIYNIIDGRKNVIPTDLFK